MKKLSSLCECVLLACAILLPSCRSGPSAQTGRWVAGSPVAEVNLLGVDLIDDKNGWAVGDIGVMNGAVLRTTDSGKTWQAVSKTDEILAAVKFISPTRGWVAGYAGRIQRTDDGGLTWKVQRAEHEGEVLNSIFFLDADRGWAAGGSGLLLLTIDGGASWEVIPTGRAEDFWSVKFVTRDRGLIAGEDGLILATVDGGREWAAQSTGTTRALLGLAAGADFAVAVGEKGTILRSDNSKSWSVIDSGTDETLNAAGLNGAVCWAVGSRGATVGSADGGRTWKPAEATLQRDLMSVSISSPVRGVAVGRRGAVQLLSPE
ncbi:MAG TPA: YCF48-related protein [Blastocatellia bacterium]|nr:YCF48-related protein [Blastocatellia bacterium]